MNDIPDLLGKLEPEVSAMPTSMLEVATVSAAISLKRIADAMEAERRDREIKRISDNMARDKALRALAEMDSPLIAEGDQ